VFNVTDLSPSQSYAAYIGHINCSEAMTNYATWTTLPDEASNGRIRVALASEDRPVLCDPKETNMMLHLEDTVRNEYERFKMSRNKGVQSQVRDKISVDSAPIHMIVHHGNTVDVDRVLQSFALPMLDNFLREDYSRKAWEALLVEVEMNIRGAYRAALGCPEMRKLLRRCGNVFLVGDDESGMKTSMMMLRKPRPPDDSDPSQSRTGGVVRHTGEINSVFGHDADNKLNDDDYDGKDDGDENLSTFAARRQGYYSSPSHHPPVDSPSNPASNMNTRTREARARVMKKSQMQAFGGKQDIEEDLRLSILGVLVRMARRISWEYFRQLWDDNTPQIFVNDARAEVIHRKYLHSFRDYEMKMAILRRLQESKQKIAKSFPEEANVHKIVLRIKQAEKDVATVRLDMMGHAKVIKEGIQTKGECLTPYDERVYVRMYTCKYVYMI
jgi:hypothetical protein